MKYESNFDNVIKEIVKSNKASLNDIGKKIVDDSKDLCPVDTGNLKNSIKFELDKDKVIIGTDVEYAINVEFGTSKQSAQSFMFKAYKNDEKEVQNIISKNYEGVT